MRQSEFRPDQKSEIVPFTTPARLATSSRRAAAMISCRPGFLAPLAGSPWGAGVSAITSQPPHLVKEYNDQKVIIPLTGIAAPDND
jgi:hypothetical protein